MTRLGKGDRYQPGLGSLVDEPTFRLRQRFVDLLQEEAPEAYDKFRSKVVPTVREVFNAHCDRETLKALLEQSGFTWDWPPSDDSEWPPYGEGFDG